MAFTVAYTMHRWADAPPVLKNWIEEEHGQQDWVALATVPEGTSIPYLVVLNADPTGYVTRDIPGGTVVAWPSL